MAESLRVVLVAKPGHADSGVGRYAGHLASQLCAQGLHVILVHPTVPLPACLLRWLKRWLKVDLESFLLNYPLWAHYPGADLYHLSSQNLATLMIFCPPRGKTLITVHDIIPWLTRQDPELHVYRNRIEAWCDRLALHGLRRADAILVDSEFTRQTLMQWLKRPKIPVTVVQLGVNETG